MGFRLRDDAVIRRVVIACAACFAACCAALASEPPIPEAAPESSRPATTATMPEAPQDAAPPASPQATPEQVALRKLDALEDPAADADAQALARTALGIAGESALGPIARRLPAGRIRCEIAAWALGESAPESPATPREVVAALRSAARDADWDCRLASISALGRLGATDAAPEALAIWRDDLRPPGTDAVALLAVAGCAGAAGDEVLAEFLERGGPESWSVLAIAAALRRGSDAWPLLVKAACSGGDPSVRATSSLALLLLAEPRSACALAECAASQPDPGIRRVQYQALAASGSPSGRALLMLASVTDPDPQLRAGAEALAMLRLQPEPRPALTVTSREVREGLDRVVREHVGSQVLGDIEAGASLVDLAAIERALRLLPLRSDRGWYDDHARLAQLRSRLLCEADPDCEPPPPRVGRPAP